MVTIQVRDDDADVRWLTFDHAEKLNVLTVDDLDEIVRVLHSGAPRAAVFTGSGDRAFSAGMHLDTFRNLDEQRARAQIIRVRDCLAAVRTAPFPTISAINGYCLGIALELALACDIRVAADHAQLGLPEIKLGFPSVVDTALLHHYVGLAKAKEMILTGDVYGVAELEPYHLFNAIVPRRELLAQTQLMLGRMAIHEPAAVAAQKRLFEIWMNQPLTAGIDASVEEFARMFRPASDPLGRVPR